MKKEITTQTTPNPSKGGEGHPCPSKGGELVGQATPEQIEIWKKKYGEIKVIEAGHLVGFFRKPDLKIWRFAIKVIDKSKSDFKRVLAKNCFVGGDKEILETPFIEDVADYIDEFIDYPEAEIEKAGNAYIVTVLDKKCRLKPVTIEMQSLSERSNPEDIPFKTQQNLLDRLWLDGDEDLKDERLLDYHMPLLRVINNLREKHVMTIKNV